MCKIIRWSIKEILVRSSELGVRSKTCINKILNTFSELRTPYSELFLNFPENPDDLSDDGDFLLSFFYNDWFHTRIGWL